MSCTKKSILSLLIACAAIAAYLALPKVPRAAGPIPQSAYVWQRAWGPDVRASVASAPPELAGLVALSAEVAWKNGEPQIARVPLDYASLRATSRPVGFALRVGPGPIDPSTNPTQLLASLAAQVLADAARAGCQPAELQIDFDCATSKLRDYRSWVAAIAGAAAPTPVSITALPAWLKSPDFAPLARAAGSFILQVHSLDKPRLDDPSASLCDTASAQTWVERAAQVGVPFRVALPTYGYVVAYDDKGHLAGLIAEADPPQWVEHMTLRQLRADPASLAQLVRTWTTDRPQLMQGILWYRLPVPGDRLNWSPSTLAAVMRGQSPAPRLQVQARSPQPGLIELVASDTGNADAPLPASVTASWSGATALGWDALAGMDVADPGDHSLKLLRPDPLAAERLRPGEERVLGWLRLSEHVEVHLDVVPALP